MLVKKRDDLPPETSACIREAVLSFLQLHRAPEYPVEHSAQFTGDYLARQLRVLPVLGDGHIEVDVLETPDETE